MCVYQQLCSLLTDQLIGPTSNDLSLVVQWWFWTLSVMHCSYWLYLGSLLTRHTQGTVYFILFSQRFCLVFCHLLLIVLYAFFLLLSKWYTLRERNREINIQAIVEEHYERYMDQEEEYEREHGESILDSDSVYSDSDSDHAFVGRILETYSSHCLCVCVCHSSHSQILATATM